jgi:hypothetical protein
VFGILDGCTLGREGVGVWLSLWLVGHCVAKSDTGFLDVSRHGEVYLPQFIIPIQCESEISCSVPIHVDFVILAKHTGEVVHVDFVDLFHSEIVDDQSETDWTPFVVPVSQCDRTLAVSCLVESLFGEELLCDDSGLREAIHSLSYFTENVAICIHFIMESILLDDILCESSHFIRKYSKRSIRVIR